MNQNRIYLLIGTLLLLILAVYLIVDKQGLDGPDKNTHFKIVKLPEGYLIEIPEYMKKMENNKNTTPGVTRYEHRGRELFLTFESYDFPDDQLSEALSQQELFAEAIESIRTKHAQPLLTKNDTVAKKLSAVYPLDLEPIFGAWYELEMAGINGAPGTYYAFGLYRDNTDYYLLSLATNAAFRNRYAEIFEKILRSFSKSNAG